MNYKEDYVSIETAKMLKEVGYDYPFTHQLYTINWHSDKFGEEAKDPNNWTSHKEIVEFSNDHIDFNQKIDNGAEKIATYTPIVSLWDAQKWFREEHKIHICIDFDFDREMYSMGIATSNRDYVDIELKYVSMGYKEITQKVYIYPKYNQALDTAIQEVCKILKEQIALVKTEL